MDVGKSEGGSDPAFQAQHLPSLSAGSSSFSATLDLNPFWNARAQRLSHAYPLSTYVPTCRQRVSHHTRSVILCVMRFICAKHVPMNLLTPAFHVLEPNQAGS